MNDSCANNVSKRGGEVEQRRKGKKGAKNNFKAPLNDCEVEGGGKTDIQQESGNPEANRRLGPPMTVLGGLKGGM